MLSHHTVSVILRNTSAPKPDRRRHSSIPFLQHDKGSLPESSNPSRHEIHHHLRSSHECRCPWRPAAAEVGHHFLPRRNSRHHPHPSQGRYQGCWRHGYARIQTLQVGAHSIPSVPVSNPSAEDLPQKHLPKCWTLSRHWTITSMRLLKMIRWSRLLELTNDVGYGKV